MKSLGAFAFKIARGQLFKLIVLIGQAVQGFTSELVPKRLAFGFVWDCLPKAARAISLLGLADSHQG
jgi:hypothetical protein